MQSRSPALYLPVEDRFREFDSKLLIAAAAAERGMISIVGVQRLLTSLLGAWVPGVFVLKGLNRVQARLMAQGLRFGHVMAALDEEAMGVADPAYMTMDVDPDIAGLDCLILAQGAVQARMLSERRGVAPDRVDIVGNPRLDLLRHPLIGLLDEEARRLRERHGRFVLVNTNNAATNCAWGGLDAYRKLCVGIGWLTPGDPEQEAMWRRHVEEDARAVAEIGRTVELLAAALPDHAIVVRPHPSERLETWQERFSASERVRVLRQGSHVPWMRAAELVLHTSCTTGLEAELADCPVLSIVPDGSATAGWYLSNVADRRVGSAAEAAALAKRFLCDGEDVFSATRPSRRAALGDHLEGLRGPFVFDRVADRLAALMPGRGTLERRQVWPDLAVPGLRERHAVQAAKMSVTLGEARERLARFGAALGRFDDLEVLPVHDDVVCVVRRGRLELPGGRFLHVRAGAPPPAAV